MKKSCRNSGITVFVLPTDHDDPLVEFEARNHGVPQSTTKLGRNTVLRTVALGVGGALGLVILLGPNPENRFDELMAAMTAAECTFDRLPRGMMPQLRSDIAMSNMMLDRPKNDHFAVAIPLCGMDERRKCCSWSTRKHDWRVKPMNFGKLDIPTRTVMLVVKPRQAA